jgi:hypothetical protein
MPRRKRRPPRRKTGDFHMRIDLTNRAFWEQEARREGMSLSAWFEALGNREVLARRQERRLEIMYPQSYRNPVDRHAARSA